MGGFRKAKAEQAFVKMAMYGASGSGKTFTSLLIGEGLAKLTGKRIAFIDTERGSDFYSQAVKERKIHPEAFDFDALYTRSLSESLEAVKALDLQHHGIIVVDSVTHLWETAKNSFDGRQTKAGTIPFHAWGKIKKPYKELINMLISIPCHIIICGRQGNEFAEDEETGELKSIGHKMKAEGETPYEPHILIRLESVKGKNIDSYPIAHIEKDRTGILSGRAIEYPDFENVIKPLLPVLGHKQAVIESEEATASHDAEKYTEEDIEKEAKSFELLEHFESRFKLANDREEAEAVAKEITPDIKKQMTIKDVATLKEIYLDTIKRKELKAKK